MKTTFKLGLLASTLVLAAGPASADVYNLCVGQTDKALPAGSTNTVPVWGYALGTATGGVCDNTPTVPGPRLTVTNGTLTINLTNTLTEPTSIVIPGLPNPTSVGSGPTWDDGTTGGRANATQRVRSFGAEAAAGVTESYSWTGVRPGSFIYHSGTHPQKQVYMGLYGAVTQDSAPGQAYAGVGPTPEPVAYDNEVVLFYSEIDPDMNNAIAGGTHETSIYYHPSWFLVNGEPYVGGATPDIAAGAAGERTLLRLFSAAGETHVPVLQGMTMTIHAEDGLQYNYQDGAAVVAAAPREQYSVMLPPLKTKDAIITAPADGRYAVYDGNGYMTNPSDPGDVDVGDTVGGMLRFLSVGASINTPPVANDDTATTAFETLVTIDVLANDIDADVGDVLSIGTFDATSVNGGTVSCTTTCDYTPPAGFSGPDTFTYQASDGTDPSNVATVTITVESAPNTPPVANDDTATTAFETLVTIDVLANDTDADVGDVLSIGTFDATSVNGGTVSCTTTCDYTPPAGFSGPDTFTYQASDGTDPSNVATVTITVNEVIVPTQLTVTVDGVPESHDILTYGGVQDVNSTTEILDGGNTFRIVGNGWKQIQLNAAYTVTADTVLEVTFSSATEGEIHGIGLDVDDTISSGTTFQFFGTQTWGIQTVNDYTAGTVTYTIPVGASFTGSFDRIIFTMDHDVATPNGEGVFSNISLTTPPPAPPQQLNVTVDGVPAALDVVTYGGAQDDNSITQILDSGATLSMVGNGWKQVLFNCSVGADTVLSFDFSSGVQGEIHGIGFDLDDTISSDTTFQLYGTQTWGIQNFRTYPGAGVVNYTIPVGTFFTGDFTRLIFVMDHDVEAPTGESLFSNIVATGCEQPPP